MTRITKKVKNGKSIYTGLSRRRPWVQVPSTPPRKAGDPEMNPIPFSFLGEVSIQFVKRPADGCFYCRINVIA